MTISYAHVLLQVVIILRGRRSKHGLRGPIVALVGNVSTCLVCGDDVCGALRIGHCRIGFIAFIIIDIIIGIHGCDSHVAGDFLISHGMPLVCGLVICV